MASVIYIKSTNHAFRWLRRKSLSRLYPLINIRIWKRNKNSELHQLRRTWELFRNMFGEPRVPKAEEIEQNKRSFMDRVQDADRIWDWSSQTSWVPTLQPLSASRLRENHSMKTWSISKHFLVYHCFHKLWGFHPPLFDFNF